MVERIGVLLAQLLRQVWTTNINFDI